MWAVNCSRVTGRGVPSGSTVGRSTTTNWDVIGWVGSSRDRNPESSPLNRRMPGRRTPIGSIEGWVDESLPTTEAARRASRSGIPTGPTPPPAGSAENSVRRVLNPSGCSSINMCPDFGNVTSSAPGMLAASSSACLAGRKLSHVPATTRNGRFTAPYRPRASYVIIRRICSGPTAGSADSVARRTRASSSGSPLPRPKENHAPRRAMPGMRVEGCQRFSTASTEPKRASFTPEEPMAGTVPPVVEASASPDTRRTARASG